ncbi:right-handed parallel beta-helix repeat-containing protein [Hymenobacter weizhouensis]|uniref:right-handed parallel beta-helix repeat-containing protein n=1 Tax=Hymenobacter sp. YIM 151500-1 TaxID=2987689 RepID=UPI002226C196|nr:right-handed parallel beta-helix repeat-containing protein [Hymenobacter sp. YIM 151500-1]UYZ63894.1 right-handed parallel beta-helix repeat-containing protein [Hymenobacter sp. YIM 151500-1]
MNMNLTTRCLRQYAATYWPAALTLLLTATGPAAVAQSSAEQIGIKATSYPVPTDGTARFISPAGNDTTGTGTEAKPWRSLSKAVAAAPAGSTIVCRAGTYRGASNGAVKLTKRLTIQPYPSEQVWFRGSLVVKDWVAEGNIWRKQSGWTYGFPRVVGDEYLDLANYPLADHRDMVFVNGARLVQVATKAEVGPGKFYVDYTSKQLYVGDNPGGKTVEATAFGHGLELVQSGSAVAGGSQVRGLGLAHFANHALVNGAPNVLVENNTLVWNGVGGLNIWGEGRARQMRVQHNTFSYNGRKGMGGSRATGLRVENNVFSHNNVERYSARWDAAGIKITRSDSIRIGRNQVFDNQSVGIWLDISCTNSVVVQNTVHHNGRYGMFFEISHRGIFAGNTVYDNADSGIHSSNSTSLQIWNNTLARNKKNIFIDDSQRNNTDSAEIARGITWIATDHVVKNNLLSNTVGGASLLETWRECRAAFTLPLVREANFNGYYRTSATQPTNVIRWNEPVTSNCGTAYPSVAGFHASTGFESDGLDLSGGSANPFFVDEAANDYRLKNGGSNPAFRRGQPLPQDVAQALGVPAGVPVDLGALFDSGSYGGGVPVVTGLTLFNADTDQALGQLGNGAVLNLATLPSRRLSVVANTTPGTVGSVRFSLDGTVLRTENAVPYAIAGDSNGNYGTWTPSLGPHTLTVTPYSAANAGGTAGPARSYSFSVIDNIVANPSFDEDGTGAQRPRGWSTTGTEAADFAASNSSPRTGGWHGSHWLGSAYTVHTHQLVRNLPNGLYTFRAWVKTASDHAGARLQVENFGGSTKTLAVPQNTWKWTQVAITDINVTNGQARIGFYSEAAANKWFHFEDVELVLQANATAARPAAPSPAAHVTGVQLYPNPTTTRLTVDFGGQVPNEEPREVTLTSVLGHTVLARAQARPGQSRLELELGHVPSGVYLVTVQRGAERTTHRVLVAH